MLPLRASLIVSCSLLAVCGLFISIETQAGEHALRPPSAFTDIADRAARSRALFTEAAKVITDPRCMNCHPASDRPLQGNDKHVHFPPAFRGDSGGGVPGNYCSACHLQ